MSRGSFMMCKLKNEELRWMHPVDGRLKCLLYELFSTKARLRAPISGMARSMVAVANIVRFLNYLLHTSTFLQIASLSALYRLNGQPLPVLHGYTYLRQTGRTLCLLAWYLFPLRYPIMPWVPYCIEYISVSSRYSSLWPRCEPV